MIQRLLAAVKVERVEHQAHVGADGLGHRAAGGHVLPGVGCPGDRRHPGVQLERGVAALAALNRERGIVVGCGQPAGQFVAAHGAGVGWHLVTRGAQQPVHRLAQAAAGQIPQRQVDRAEHLVRERADMQPLPFLEPLPDPLAVERILAEQRRPNDLRNDLRVGAEAVALGAIVGDDPEQALRGVVLGTGMGMALRVADDLRAIAEHLGGHVDNLHPASSSIPEAATSANSVKQLRARGLLRSHNRAMSWWCLCRVDYTAAWWHVSK